MYTNIESSLFQLKKQMSHKEKRKLIATLLNSIHIKLTQLKRKQKNNKMFSFLKLIQNNKNLKFELLMTKSYTKLKYTNISHLMV